MKNIHTENRAFQEMRKPALERLQGKNPEAIAQNAGMEYDRTQKMFSVESLGRKIQVSFPQYEILPELKEWHHLLLLHYMDLADGTPLSGQLITFGELSQGMVRGGRFDQDSERTLSQQLGCRPPDLVKRACEELGAESFASNADLSVRFLFFPRYPVILKLWFADEELPGSGRLLLDKSAEHYLSVEDAVTAGALLLEALLGKLKMFYK